MIMLTTSTREMALLSARQARWWAGNVVIRAKFLKSCSQYTNLNGQIPAKRKVAALPLWEGNCKTERAILACSDSMRLISSWCSNRFGAVKYGWRQSNWTPYGKGKEDGVWGCFGECQTGRTTYVFETWWPNSQKRQPEIGYNQLREGHQDIL